MKNRKVRQALGLSLAVLMTCDVCTVNTLAATALQQATKETTTQAVMAAVETKEVNKEVVNETPSAEQSVTEKTIEAAKNVQSDAITVQQTTENVQTTVQVVAKTDAEQSADVTVQDTTAWQTQEEVVDAVESVELTADGKEEYTSGSFVYVLNDDKEAVITKYTSQNATVVIPEKLGNYTVTELDARAFTNNKVLTSVTIPATIKKAHVSFDISYYQSGPFEGTNLTNVTIANGIKSIPQFLFAGAEKLKTVKIPDSVQSIGTGAFSGCKSLNNITIPKKVSSIGEFAFLQCTSLTSIVIPDAVTEIPEGAFKECAALTKVTLSQNLRELQRNAFAKCGLTSVQIPASLDKGHVNCDLLSYSDGPFAGSELKSVTFEKGIRKIPQFLFAGADKLAAVTIPSTVKTIETGSFKDCSALKTVNMSDNVQTIEEAAFSGCTVLTGVKLSKNLRDLGRQAFSKCKALTSITIPASLETGHVNCDLENYEDGPFENSGLKTVQFEAGTYRIAPHLFAGAANIQTITLPATVKSVGEGAFAGCTGLKTVNFSDKITKIDEYAFSGCTSLTGVKLPASIKTLERRAFARCTSLKTIAIPKSLEEANVRYNFINYTDGPFEKSGLETVTFEAGMTKILDHLFAGADHLKAVAIPDTVTEIGASSFNACSALTKVTIGKNVRTIGESAFRDCSSLTSVNLPGKITEIEKYTFAGTESLKSIAIPATVTEIGKCAFQGSGLTQVVLPDKLTKLGQEVFSDCEDLGRVVMSKNLAVIPYRAFYNCTEITTAILYSGTEKVEKEAFALCNKLTAVTVPRTVTEIASDAFTYTFRMTLTGVKGTYAETFANENDIEFVNKTVKATSVKIDKTTARVNKGDKIQLSSIVEPVTFTDVMTWSSSDPEIATVDAHGLVTAKKGGTVDIKVKVGSRTATCRLTVIQKAEWISGYPSEFSINQKQTYQIKAEAKPNDTSNKTLKWTTSNANIVRVDANGKVTGVKAGTATVTAAATDGSNVKKAFTVHVKEVLGATISVSQNAKTATFTARATGGSGYQYQFMMYNPATQKTVQLCNYTTKNTVAWTLAGTGTRRVYVNVKDSAGRVVRSEAVAIGIGNMKPKVTVSVNKASVKAGDKVQITAKASAGKAKYQYRYLLQNPTTGNWSVLKEYSASNTYVWTAAGNGKKRVYVDVKDANGVVTRSAAVAVNTIAKPTVTVKSSTTSAVVGSKVTFTAKAASGSGKYQYRFLLKNPQTGKWAVLKEYSTSNTYTWTAGGSGARHVYVDVKDSNGTVTRSAACGVTVKAASAKPTVKIKGSVSSAAAGSKVTLTATAAGGSGKYQYRFLLKNPQTGKWAVLKEYSTSNTYVWTAGGSGARHVYVDVKDSSGTIVRSAAYGITVQTKIVSK